jgi:signal transduction histidine kinase
MATATPTPSLWRQISEPVRRLSTGGSLGTGGLVVVVLVTAVMGSVYESSYSSLHVVLVAVMLVPLAWRNRRPRLVAVWVSSAAAVIWLVTQVDWHTGVAGGIAIYALGRQVDRPESLRWFGGILVSLSAVAAAQALFDEATSQFVVPARASVVVAAFWFGDAQRSREHLLSSLRERAERAEEHRRVVERQAVLDERNRISRELHDVIAHSLSVIVVQSDAAVRLAPVDTNGSVAAMEAVADVGRDTMSELRNVLGLLNDEDGSRQLVADQLTPQPVLADLPLLIDRYRQAGIDVTVAVDGEASDATDRASGDPSGELLVAELERTGAVLPASVQLAVVRVVQEALTNVLKHAPGAPVTIAARRHLDRIDLAIRNGPRPPGSDLEVHPVAVSGGRGLVGMEQRVQSLGGEFAGGSRADGGFEVTVSIPVSGG